MLRSRQLLVERRQAGDTIIEVLIAVAVITLILVGSYVSVNRNVLVGQDTQEHSQALQLVQSQIEFLRADTTGSVPICYQTTGAHATMASSCLVDSQGDPTTTAEPRYKLRITPTTGSTYKVSAIWDSLVGKTGNVTVYYRK